MPSSSSSPGLKRKLFARDGWLVEEPEDSQHIHDGLWRAHCAFGCGAVLTFGTATVDRWPVPGRAGGRYKLGNTRLACRPCNFADGHRANKWGQAVMPGLEELSVEERRAWWREQGDAYLAVPVNEIRSRRRKAERVDPAQASSSLKEVRRRQAREAKERADAQRYWFLHGIPLVRL